MCPFHSCFVTPSLSTKVTESHRSITLTCGVDVLLRDLWEDQAQQSSAIHEPMMPKQARKNKSWSIECFTLQNFRHCPPKPVLVNVIQQKNKQIHSSVQYFNASIYVINTSSQKEWNRWVGASAQFTQPKMQLDLGFFLLVDVIRNSFRNSHLSRVQKAGKAHGTMGRWNSTFEGQRLNIFGLVNKSLHTEVQLTTGIKWHSND